MENQMENEMETTIMGLHIPMSLTRSCKILGCSEAGAGMAEAVRP